VPTTDEILQKYGGRVTPSAPAGAPPAAPTPEDIIQKYGGRIETPPAAPGYRPAAGPAPTHDVEVVARTPFAQAAGTPEAQRASAGLLSWMPGFEALGLLPQATQEKVAQAAPEVLRTALATGISTAGGVGGALAGGAVAGPPGALVGEMAGSLAARKANVALGLEDPGVGADIVAAAGPLASRAISLGARAATRQASPAAQEILDLARQHNVDVSVGDVTRQPVAKRAEVLMEQVPILGTGAFRARQQQQTSAAAAETARGLQTKMQAQPFRDVAALERAAASGTPGAQALLDDVANAGEDWNRIVQTSGKLSLFHDRQKAGRLYDRVTALAQPLGDIPVPKTLAAVRQSLADVEAMAVVPPEVRSQVQGLLGQVDEALSPTVRQQARESASTILGPTGQPLQGTTAQTITTPADTRFDRLRQLRSNIGDVIRDATDAQTAHYLHPVKAALEADMAQHIAAKGSPQLQRAWKEADTFYKQRVVPYKEGMLAKAIQRDLPDEIYPKFVKQGADRAQFFYNGLDEKGQAAVRYGMVAEALDASVQPTTGVFSPAKFAGSLERIRDASGVFFRGKGKFELDGITKLMRHTERAGQYMENQPTGQRLIPLLIGGGIATVSPTAAVAGATGTLALRGLLTTERGRALLLAASDMTPGSPAMTRLVESLPRELARIAGPEALQERSAPEGQP
jgi:hypothetical protein